VHAQPHQAPPLLGVGAHLLLGWRRRRHGRAALLGAAVIVMGAVHSAEVDVRHEEQQEVEVGPDPAERDATDAEAEDADEEEVDGHVEEQRRGGAVGERQRDGLRAEVDADRVEEALQHEVGEAPQDVGVRRGRDVRVLPRGDEDPVHGHPEHGDGHARGQEQQDGAPERGAEEVRPPRAEGLAADGVHPAGEAGEDGVAGDVGEAEREGAAGEGQLAEAAEEHHGHQGAHVEQDPRADHWPGEAEDGGHLSEHAAGAGAGAGRRPRAVVQLRVALGRREERPVVALRQLRALARRHGASARPAWSVRACRGLWFLCCRVQGPRLCAVVVAGTGELALRVFI